MGWGARFEAAWQGKVSGADLGALFAATARLDDLRQALADRRLNAEIAQASQAPQALSGPQATATTETTTASQSGQAAAGQTDYEWRIQLELGPLAAPIWLADALVGMAQAFDDEETQGQPKQRDPNHPPYVSPYTHDVIAALLAPVEDIIADVTTALADPNHRLGLTAPLHIGPRHEIAGYDLPRPPSPAYARGLAKATRRVHTAAATLLLDTQTALAKSSAPDWLTSGLQRLDGALQGASARLDMIETRMEPLVTPTGRDSSIHNADPAALTTICADLWAIADTAFVAGQQISDPHLLPESPPVAPRAVAPSSSRQTPRQASVRTSGPQAPTQPVRQSPPAPQYQPIAPGIPPDPMPPTRPHAAAPPPDLALPTIAEGAPSLPSQASAAPTPPHEAGPAPASHPVAQPPADLALPTVGGQPGASPAAPAAHEPGTSPTEASHSVSPASLPTVGAGASQPTSALPDIGDAAPSAPVEPAAPRPPTVSEDAKSPQSPAPQRPATPKNKVDDAASTLFPEIG